MWIRKKNAIKIAEKKIFIAIFLKSHIKIDKML